MRRLKIRDCAARIVVPTILMLNALSPAAWSAPTTIVNNGPPANRVDIIFLGDGYTQADLNAGVYDQHVLSFLDHMFTTGGILADPFPRYKNFFNVHKITVASNESGADIPSQSIFRDTALDATYDTAGIDRFLSISTTKAEALRDAELAGTGITADAKLVTVNHSKYGGSTVDGWAVYGGANPSADDFELHEVGHAYSRLLDEYGGIPDPYVGPDFNVPNVTTNSTGQKWSHWLGFVDPRDPGLTIGAYQGGAGYDQGVYRPSPDSKMRSLYRPFDAVGREASILRIYDDVDPLDDWLENSQTVIDSDLWADVIDPEVIRLQWFVDDVLVPGATGEQFHARDYGYGPGTYEVRVRAYDDILNHSFSGDMLDLVRTGLSALEQAVSWSLTITPASPGDFNGDDIVNSRDFDLWKRTFGSTTLLAADGNNNSIVNAADYVVWRKFLPSGGGASSNLSIPEPLVTHLMLAVLLIGRTIRRRRRAQAARKRAR